MPITGLLGPQFFELLALDATVARQIIADYCAAVPLALAELHTLQHQPEALARAVHSLKGMSLNVGAEGLGAYLGVWDAALKAGHAPAPAPNLAETERLWAATLAEIQMAVG